MSAGISIIFHRFVALELRMCHDLEPRSLVKGQNAHSGFTTVWAMTGVYCYVCVALVVMNVLIYFRWFRGLLVSCNPH